MFKSLVERDKDVIWHPYTQMKLAPSPLPIVKGEGVYLIDEQGNRYIDAISSWWVNLHGHAHSYLAEKIYEQAKKLEQVIFAGFTHEPAIQLAERLVSVLPGKFSKVFYSDNGSTAVEVALKMAIQYWKNRNGKKLVRKKILALTDSYHGDTFGAMSVSGRGPFTLAFEDYLFEVVFVEAKGSNYSTPNASSTEGIHDKTPIGNEDLQQSGFSNTSIPQKFDKNTVFQDLDLNEFACFIYEPLVQGAGGMKMYSADWLNDLLKACKEHDVICIADEVMTGFGRTGKLFASEYIEEKPDIICLSKGLTGGMMALGATVCTQKIYDAFLSDDRSKTFFHGHSYTANPIACAAGAASLDLLEGSECLKNIKRIGEAHEAFALRLRSALEVQITESPHVARPSTTLRTSASFNNAPSDNVHSDNMSAAAIHRRTSHVKNIRQLGTILAFEVETEGQEGYLNNISTTIHKQALEKGVLIRPLGNTVYIMPPYCISDGELQTVYNCVTEIITNHNRS